MKLRSFKYGDKVIYYSRSDSRVANEKLRIKVHHDGSVVAHAPLSTPEDVVKDVMVNRARWIWKQQEKVSGLLVSSSKRQYISGECHYYLGRRYILKVLTDQSTRTGVKLFRGKFEVKVHELDPEDQVRKLLNNWYQQRAEDVFQRRLLELLPKASWVGDIPNLKLRRMTKQWGNCSVDHVLTLNTHLVKAPRDCIDYVIFHELCHVSEHNHSERFYRLLYSVMPDWEARKSYLDKHASYFLN